MEELSHTEREALMEKAFDMLAFSYAPYSRFRVGAALLARDGRIFGGCNVENAAYSPSCCAERTAVCKAVSEGCTDFRAIAVTGGKEGEVSSFTPPCGVCRQVLAEFCNPEAFPVIVAKSREEYLVRTLAELLPESFGPASLRAPQDSEG